jgi:hypothetical protein
MPLGVVNLFQIGVVGNRLDPCLACAARQPGRKDPSGNRSLPAFRLVLRPVVMGCSAWMMKPSGPATSATKIAGFS